MKQTNWFVRLETPSDNDAIEAMQAAAFGPGRFARTAFRIREGVPHRSDLSFVGLSGHDLAGSVRLTPIVIGAHPGLLLGPLTVAPAHKNRGLGRTLLRAAVDAAAKAGEHGVLLVGDEAYYAPLGFQRVPLGSILLPGPVDPARILVAPLNGAGIPAGRVRGGRRTA
ncbi:MAG: N-acetyltransferase [Roseibium sp.]|nr:N-acetyltransferase [Roseibium sp.]